MDAHSEAHIFIAAIRVLAHKKGHPPSLEETCSLIGYSEEAGHALCRRLQKLEIIEILEDPFSINLTIKNYLKIEELPKTEEDPNSLAKEIEKFKNEKADLDAKVKNIQASMAKKKNDMFADVEAKFKKEMEKFKNR